MRRFLLTAAALALLTTAANAGDVYVSTSAQACAKVTTECQTLAVGTVVIEKNYWSGSSCVVPYPAGPSEQCLWISIYALTYPQGYQPVVMTPQQLADNQINRRYAGNPPVPGEPEGGRLQIQFQRGANEGSRWYRGVVSVRNTSNTDFASVAWNCKFYDAENYKVGEGVAVFYHVRSQTITFDSVSFPLNVGIGLVSKLDCELVGTEKLTKDNARLYQPGRNWGSDSLRSSFWDGRYKPQGEFAVSKLN